ARGAQRADGAHGPLKRCPVCDRRVWRFAAGALPRSRCPRCGALQRHRLLWLFLERETTLLRDGGRLLHFAPEAGIATRLAGTPGIDYVSADLAPGAAMLALDL